MVADGGTNPARQSSVECGERKEGKLENRFAESREDASARLSE